MSGEMPNPFKSMDEIVAHLTEEVKRDPAALATWQDIVEEDLIQGHHSTGRAIRNKYLLWHEANPYTDIQDAMSPIHPDQFSMEVMKRVRVNVTLSKEDD